ncbi:indolepyruvate ferredoxin oxidoreductase subunit alpha [Candidatus Bathyarchaeota archaeon]|nr:indolepyruvate ferredoxin oxidoreductase subunit alpha [Candidatus Bathyarchaeota archaeon]
MNIVCDDPGKRVLLLGNEAFARGAVEAGVQLCSAYPGTPSTEITETLAGVAKESGIYVEWSTNEVVAFEVAAGAAIVGGRALFACKNAGFNVVMDMLMTLPYTGVRGGMVIVVADDPGAWYSSNEQDTRIMGFYAELPVFEPRDQQEAKDMTREAFELSEALELPVIIRSCTRLSHASGDVVLGGIRRERNEPAFDKHWKVPYRWNVYGPPGPVAKHQWQKNKMPSMVEYSDETPFNRLDVAGGNRNVGIITSGMASNYTQEALERLGVENEVHLMVLGMPYPIPPQKVKTLLGSCRSVLCIEEGEPLIERQVHQIANEMGCPVKVVGKLEGNMIPPVDELNPDTVLGAVAEYLGEQVPRTDEPAEGLRSELKELVCARSSSWCPGCPHLGSFWALKKALPADKVNIINTGIGCYEMSGYGIAAVPIDAQDTVGSKRWRASSPYEMTDTLYIMGSETGLSQGQYHVGYRDGKIVSVLGDSSFYHTNMPAIVNAVYNKAEQLILVLDNFWTCMTGHQPNPSTGITATNEEVPVINIEEICRAFGVKFVKSVDPYDLDATEEAMKEALSHKGGPAVIVTRRLCALQRLRELRRAREKAPLFEVNDKCTGCRQCLYLGCPAIGFDKDKTNAVGAKGVAFIDPLQCVGCGLCDQKEVCRFDAHDKVQEGTF